MARVEDLDGRRVEGTYLDPDGLRDLVRQLHAIVLLLDDMAAPDGETGAAAARYAKDERISGAQYLVRRNTATLKDTRDAVVALAATYRDLLNGTVRMIDDHTGRDGDAHDDVRTAGGAARG